jgi:hypothetical protein
MPPSTAGIPRRGNGAAIASFVLGLLGCVPWITGFLAVLLGILGMRKARDPQVGGKGFALAGIILGLLSFAAWSVFGTAMFGVIFGIIHGTAAQRALARQFLADLSEQDLPAAQSIVASSLTPEQVQALADKVKPWGTLLDATTTSVNYFDIDGSRGMTIRGIAQFANGSHPYSITFRQENKEWKIDKLEFR